MDVAKPRRQAFVIEVIADAGEAWYGTITHIAPTHDGTRPKVYFRRLVEIPLVIAPYLQDLGTDLGPSWHLWRWALGLGRLRS